MHKAVDEMGRAETFHGYAPDLGYEFLREAIVKGDYEARGCDIRADEIFVSDGAKCDCSNIHVFSGSAGQNRFSSVQGMYTTSLHMPLSLS